jgi:hypothetical protein
MKLTWDQQLSFVPKRLGGTDAVSMPFVQVVTWNDFPEGTAVEPSVEYGIDALVLTQTASAAFRAKEKRGETLSSSPPPSSSSSTTAGSTASNGNRGNAVALGRAMILTALRFYNVSMAATRSRQELDSAAVAIIKGDITAANAILNFGQGGQGSTDSISPGKGKCNATR